MNYSPVAVSLEKIFFAFIINVILTIVLIILSVVFHNDITSSVRAIGVQCNVNYTNEIPDPIVEDVN